MINRLRHTYGFGVHSPLAYGVLRDVVRGAHRYYGYADLADDALRLGCGRRERRLAFLVHRLVARCAPARICGLQEMGPLVREAVRLADSRYLRRGADWCRDGDGPTLHLLKNEVDDTLLESLKAGDMLLAVNLQEKPLFEPREGLLMLCGRHSLLAMRRERIAPTLYTVKL